MLFDIDFEVGTEEVQSVSVPLETYHRLQQFLYHEARLLDERKWQEWLDLWTEDGMYWMPQSHDQTSPYDHISLLWENKLLRELRVRTLENPRNWAQQPVTRSSRIVSNIMIDGTDEEGNLVVRSAFQMTDWRKGQQRHMAGTIIHKLVSVGDSWQIRMKQVNLVNCSDVQNNIQVYC